MLFMSCVYHAFTSVYCCRERADLLALVCDVYCGFVTFSFGILGEVWYLIVSIPDHCCLFYLCKVTPKKVDSYVLGDDALIS